MKNIFYFIAIILLFSFYSFVSFADENIIRITDDSNFTNEPIKGFFLAQVDEENTINSLYDRDKNERSKGKDWQAFIAIYLWLSGLNGETGRGDNVSDVDLSFGDIWENFDVGGQAHIEFWWKKWIFFIDPTFIKLTANNSQTRVLSSIRSDLEVKLFQFDFAGGYRIAEIPLGTNTSSNKFKT